MASPHLLKGDIEAANSNAAPVIKDSAEALEKGSETWRDEEKLEKSLDNLDHRLNVVQAEAEKNGENIDRQEALERLKAEADRFTNQDANGRYSMKTRLDVIKDNWENRKGFWQFLKTSFADLFFKYGAVRTSLPGLNLINYAQKEAQEFKEEYGELGEDVLDKANQTRRGLRHKKNIEKEGPEALMLVKSGLSAFRTKASVTGKQALLDLVHGKNGKMNPKEYVMKNIDTSDLAALEKKYPKTFASQAQHYGVKARKLKGKAAVFELSTRLFDWYLHPAHRTRASVGEEVKEVAVGLVPFSSTFSFLQDGAAELNHLPTWAKYSILAGEFGLDVATTLGLAASVFTGGTVAPVVAGASFAGKTALRTGVRKMATKSVEKSAARNTAKGAMGVVSKMGTKTRETLFSTFSAKVLVGYGSLSALSALALYE